MNQRDKLTYIREGQPPGSVYRYWSPWNKEVLVQQLGEYEDTGLSPQGIRNLEDLYVGLLMNQTRADVKPVVRGRWEETGDFSDEMIDWVRCSKCGEEAPGFTDNYNFCPHCGADMREGEHD